MEQDKGEKLPIGWQHARTISLERSTKQENLGAWFNGNWEVTLEYSTNGWNQMIFKNLFQLSYL